MNLISSFKTSRPGCSLSRKLSPIALLKPSSSSCFGLTVICFLFFGLSADLAADLVTFWDSTGNVSEEALTSGLATNSSGSSVFETLDSGSSFFGQLREVNSLTFQYNVASSDWSGVEFRLGEVLFPFSYNTVEHASSSVGNYANVSNERLDQPDNLNWQTPIGQVGGLDIFELRFDNLSFWIDPNEDWTPILSPFTGGQSFQYLATNSNDAYANINLLGGTTRLLSEYGISTNTALSWKAEGRIVSVPEPGSGIVGIGILATAAIRRRRQY